MGHSSVNVSLTYLRGSEIPELTEDDIPVVYYLYCETLFLTFQAINISKN